jgi:GTP cyclohydrolase I
MKAIRFVSLCSHHLAPFEGTCHVGYIPDGKIAGLSKLARQVQTSAKMPTVQEELTTAIADTFDDILDPQGVIVIMKARHSCMSLRGAFAHESETITSAVRGQFLTNERGIKEEFLRLIGL